MKNKLYKTITGTLLVVSIVTFHTPIYAEDTTSSAILTITAIPNQRGKQAVPERIVTIRYEMEQKRQEMKDQADKLREGFQASREAKKQEMMDRIQQIKDERKKAIVEKMQTKIVEMNTKALTRFTETLNKLITFTDEYEQKVNDMKKPDADTTAFDAALVKARASITAAEDAVNEQSRKTYDFNIQNENVLRTTVGATISQFRKDFQAVVKKVNDARLDVVKVRVEMNRIIMKEKIDSTPTATSAAQ